VVKALFDKAEAALTSIFLHHSIDEIAPTIPMGKEQEDFDDTQDGEDIGKKKGKGKAKERERSNTSLFSDIVRQAFMDDLKVCVAFTLLAEYVRPEDGGADTSAHTQGLRGHVGRSAD
jgi:hypothetical protein